MPLIRLVICHNRQKKGGAMFLKKGITIIALSLSLFAFTACEQKGTAEKAGQKVDQTAEKVSEKISDAKEAISDKAEKTEEYMNDAAITAKIKADILSDPLLKVSQINVVTTKGVVTLSGVVDTQQSIDRAMEIAKSVKDVKSVENSLVVKGS